MTSWTGEGGTSAPARPDITAGQAQGRFRWATPRTALVVGVLTLLMFAASVPLAKIAKTQNTTVLMVPFAVLGFVLARRQPRNPIGWIMLLLGPFFILSTDASFYSLLAYHVRGHDLPWSRLAVVLAPSWVLLQVVLPLPDPAFPGRPDRVAALALDVVGVPGDRRALGRHPWRTRIRCVDAAPSRS